MSIARAASPSPGRIVRLAVVADVNGAGRGAAGARMGRMCEVARVDTLWVRLHDDGDGGALATLAEVAAATSTLALGVTPVDHALAAAIQENGENGENGGRGAPGEQRQGGRIHDRLHLCAEELSALHGFAAVAGVSERLSAYVADGAQAAEVAAHAVVPVVRATSSRGALAAVLRDVRATLRAAGIPPGTGVAAELPVSIGRTVAEAEARGGDHQVREAGLFGTLEQCQAQAQQLVYAGATELRCVVPTTPDVDDVIAQLCAVVVGDRDRLQPDRPRSPDPLPPAGWGGPPTRTGAEPGATADARRH